MMTSTKPAALDAVIRKQLADSLEHAAKDAGLSLLLDQLTCDLGNGFTILSAPIAHAEGLTAQELSKGTGLVYAYLAHAESRELPAGFYTIRVATSGYDFSEGTLKISFVDAQGKTAYSFAGESAQLRKGPEQSAPTPEEFAARSLGHGRICGSRKCFKWDRVGPGKWEFGCSDLAGNATAC
ncbi:MAG: hypothetical protein JWM21_116 [Acidobacteria bacterium]|nr:hypothetical protein [Acidobacteriota bacterium]